jgi:hypothetical protein
LPFLDREGYVRSSDRLADVLAAMAHDHAQAPRLQFPRGIQDVCEKGLSRERMQDLGQVREHPLALARRQDDDLEHGVR